MGEEFLLLVLDNANDLVMARLFIPPGNNGHVLFTTRAGAVGAVARGVDNPRDGDRGRCTFIITLGCIQRGVCAGIIPGNEIRVHRLRTVNGLVNQMPFPAFPEPISRLFPPHNTLVIGFGAEIRDRNCASLRHKNAFCFLFCFFAPISIVPAMVGTSG